MRVLKTTQKTEKDLDHASILIYNLTQDTEYLNLDINNLILFLYIYDSLKLFSHQIMNVSIMLELE